MKIVVFLSLLLVGNWVMFIGSLQYGLVWSSLLFRCSFSFHAVWFWFSAPWESHSS